MRATTLLRRAVLAGLFAVLSLPLPADEAAAQQARNGSGDARASDEQTQWMSEVDFGYGHGLDLSSDATYVGDVRFVGVLPRVGRRVGERFGRNAWYEGRLEVLVELPVLVSQEPEEGHALGLSLLGRYVFRGADRIHPFVGLGAGPIHLAFNNERNQSDGLNFTLQGGGGVRFDVSSGWSLLGRALFHHISNAGLRKPNPGINGVLFTVGISRRIL